jgi:hypothetical protein
MSWIEPNELLAIINLCEATQQELAKLLGHGYKALKGAGKTQRAMLTLLWKEKMELYAQDVKVQLERHPLRNATLGKHSGNKLKEQILAAIKQQKGLVKQVIKSFNMQRNKFLKK